MFDPLSIFDGVNWQEYYQLFANGTPPLIFQLLILNTIFLIVQAFRHRQKKALLARPRVGHVLQFVLIAANTVILTNGDFNYI